MSCIQFFVCGILCMIPTILFEHPELYSILQAWEANCLCRNHVLWSRIYFADCCTKNTDPTVASLLLSLESVFSVLAGWVLLGETLSPREIFGCAPCICGCDSCAASGREGLISHVEIYNVKNPVLIIRLCDKVSRFFDDRLGILHCYTKTGIFDHGQIIEAVAAADHGIGSETDTVQKLLQRVCFYRYSEA